MKTVPENLDTAYAPDLPIGDLVFHDRGALGIEVLTRDGGKMLVFLNDAGARGTEKWLQRRNKIQKEKF